LTGWDNGGLVTVSGYATTPSKTWTELADINSNQGTIDPYLAVASAQSGSLTQITDYSATLSAATDTTHGTLIIVRPPTSATGSNTLVTTTPTVFAQTGKANATSTSTFVTETTTVNTQSGRGEQPTQWTDQTETLPTWSDETV
jgi:hypothetical protein